MAMQKQISFGHCHVDPRRQLIACYVSLSYVALSPSTDAPRPSFKAMPTPCSQGELETHHRCSHAYA